MYTLTGKGAILEIWDIYDAVRVKTGQTKARGSLLEQGEYHLVVHVCIFNSKGEMLIQQRQPFKNSWPNMWDITVGGAAVSGDSSQVAAERELFEEIGYRVDFDGIRPQLSVNFDEGFDDYYLVERDLEIDILKLQDEEVKQVKWASEDEIIAMMNKGEFIPYHKQLIGLLFIMRTAYGAHRRSRE